MSALDKKFDPRTINKVIFLHLCLFMIVAFFCLFAPLYSIYVTDPNTDGPTVTLETHYTLHCYVYRANIHPSNCYQPASWNACYKILVDINTGKCDQNKLVVGSENLESYGATVDILISLIFILLILSFIPLLGITFPNNYKNSLNRTAIFFHFLAAIMALALAHTIVSITDETTIDYKHGLGQSPHIQSALYVISAAPLLHLILDNFHHDIV